MAASVVLATTPEAANDHTTHRVVLLDGREDRRAVMNAFVERCGPLTVVGLAGNLAEAEAQIRARNADVAIVELALPINDGLATIASLRDQFPSLRIVACSFHADAATVEAAHRNGADAYAIKPLHARDFLRDLVGTAD
jgi:DNA-binding NarL/FixJ family response regulator